MAAPVIGVGRKGRLSLSAGYRVACAFGRVGNAGSTGASGALNRQAADAGGASANPQERIAVGITAALQCKKRKLASIASKRAGRAGVRGALSRQVTLDHLW